MYEMEGPQPGRTTPAYRTTALACRSFGRLAPPGQPPIRTPARSTGFPALPASPGSPPEPGTRFGSGSSSTPLAKAAQAVSGHRFPESFAIHNSSTGRALFSPAKASLSTGSSTAGSTAAPDPRRRNPTWPASSVRRPATSARWRMSVLAARSHAGRTVRATVPGRPHGDVIGRQHSRLAGRRSSGRGIPYGPETPAETSCPPARPAARSAAGRARPGHCPRASAGPCGQPPGAGSLPASYPPASGLGNARLAS